MIGVVLCEGLGDCFIEVVIVDLGVVEIDVVDYGECVFDMCIYGYVLIVGVVVDL